MRPRAVNLDESKRRNWPLVQMTANCLKTQPSMSLICCPPAGGFGPCHQISTIVMAPCFTWKMIFFNTNITWNNFVKYPMQSSFIINYWCLRIHFNLVLKAYFHFSHFIPLFQILWVGAPAVSLSDQRRATNGHLSPKIFKNQERGLFPILALYILLTEIISCLV